jgi:hypothetical protein
MQGVATLRMAVQKSEHQTVVGSGKVSIPLIQSYVLPLVVTSFSLSVFAGVLYARNKGKTPGFRTEEAKDKKTAPN